MKKLSTKIGLLIVVFLTCTIAFMYVFTDFLYERLYVQDSEQAMVEIGTKLQSGYRGDAVTDTYVAEVEAFNRFSNYEVFAVRNPKELSACVPFEIDYDALIGPEERKVLLKGEPVTDIGYVERFDRQVISVVLPLADDNRLEGILYLYYPLASITEMANTEAVLLVIGAFIFIVLATIFVFQMLRKIMHPLYELKQAVQRMSDGDYNARVIVKTNDEIGQVAEAFNEMAQTIQQEDESQKAFLATVSHELRTPLSYVKGYSESILQGLVTGEQLNESIRVIAREANRMERLTNDLMQVVRREGDMKLDSMPLVYAEVLRDCVQLVEKQASMKQIAIDLQLDEGVIVEGDEERLKQIFINILENALRYSDIGGQVIVCLFELKGQAVVEIEDHGIGISEEHLAKVTERFYRVNKARSRKDGGSGLGLSIALMLVKLHGGTLQIESEMHKGTIVRVTIPLLEE